MHVSPELLAAITNRTVRVAPLVELDFKSETMRVWAGFGNLEAAGKVWSGLGELGSIGGIELPINGTAPQITLSLSGLAPNMMSHVLASDEEVNGRFVGIYLQHFNEAWQTLDAPLSVFMGRMDVIKIKAPDALTRAVEVTCEWLFDRRSSPSFSYLSHDDQQARYPGDMGLSFMASMQDKTVIFPS